MPTYTVNIYNNDPLFILSGTVGNTASWTGEAKPSGTATITDNEPGVEGLTIDSNASGGESATADITVGGSTSTGAGIYAEESWTLRDTVTGETFNVITFRVTSGGATGYYTLSETPLVSGRSYETLEHDTDPDVTAGDPAFSIDDYVEAGFEVDGTTGDDNIDAGYVDADGDSVGGGNDTVLAGAGNDTVFAGAGDDTVFGGTGNDSIHGGAGDDSLSGGDGDDTLIGGAGADTLSGGAGLDIVDYSASDAAVNVDLSTGSYGGGDATGDTGSGVDGIIGSDFNDTLTGFDGIFDGGTTTNYIDGGAGNDLIDGLDGGDTLIGGAGDDTVLGGGGGDQVFGGSGDDTLSGGSGDDVIRGDSDPSASSSESLNWGAEGASGTDISSGVSQDTGGMTVTASFARGPINDVIETSGTTQHTEAGEPFDPNSALYLTSGSGAGDNVTVTLGFAAEAGSGLADEVSNVSFRVNDIDQGSWQDIVTITAFDAAGNPVPATITVSGDDSLSGNTVTAGGGGDSADEAAGSILVEVAGPAASVVIDYDNGDTGGQALWVTDVHFDTIAADTAANADSIDGGAGDDTLYGEAGDDTLTGGTGADQLFGGLGDDTMFVSEGDTADGGDGDDLFVLTDLAGPGTGTITITGGEGGETAGDTLQLTADVGQDDITFTNTDDAAGGLSGSFTVNGTQVTFSEIENIICFTPGARILTETGERPVESLRPGDMVITRDHGAQPVRWTGRRTVAGTGRFAPVRVAADVLDGARAPLTVSPQHRLLFTGYRAELLFGCDEVLVAAKHLVDGQTVTRTDQAAVTYIHLMFDHHEVIYAEGAATESFHAGEAGFAAIDGAAREELFAIFPELRSHPDRHGPTARPCLRRHEARLLMPAA